MYIKEKAMLPAYISKNNATHEKQINLLMIPNEEVEEGHYLEIKKIVYIIKRNNIKTSWWLSLLELSSFHSKRK